MASAAFCAAVDKRAVGDSAGEALVPHHHGDIGNLLGEMLEKRLDVLHALGWGVVEALRLADNDKFDRLGSDIFLEPVDEGVGGDCRKSGSDNLERVGNSDTCALASVVNG